MAYIPSEEAIMPDAERFLGRLESADQFNRITEAVKPLNNLSHPVLAQRKFIEAERACDVNAVINGWGVHITSLVDRLPEYGEKFMETWNGNESHAIGHILDETLLLGTSGGETSGGESERSNCWVARTHFMSLKVVTSRRGNNSIKVRG